MPSEKEMAGDTTTSNLDKAIDVVGIDGDSRIQNAVAASLDDKNLSHLDALRASGYDYPPSVPLSFEHYHLQTIQAVGIEAQEEEEVDPEHGSTDGTVETIVEDTHTSQTMVPIQEDKAKDSIITVHAEITLIKEETITLTLPTSHHIPIINTPTTTVYGTTLTENHILLPLEMKILLIRNFHQKEMN
ncbi:predicted protein [Chaetoceros tenuissimus]|uniref:Uncharacterized protein n=1 Tax=Chaetoceros tenuissimus TaxID=426638 RepID=A0AAD3CVM2_9STRA|nr:predicted protein [Chaetoceros tenuissimus]